MKSKTLLIRLLSLTAVGVLVATVWSYAYLFDVAGFALRNNIHGSRLYFLNLITPQPSERSWELLPGQKYLPLLMWIILVAIVGCGIWGMVEPLSNALRAACMLCGFVVIGCLGVTYLILSTWAELIGPGVVLVIDVGTFALMGAVGLEYTAGVLSRTKDREVAT